MIKNERQYKITKAETEKIDVEVRRRQATLANSALHPLLAKAELEGLQSQLEDLRDDLARYEALRSGKEDVATVRSIRDIPKSLIEARIRSGMTQQELAGKIGMKPQQLQRYEATDYSAASLSRIAEIAGVLQLDLGDE